MKYYKLVICSENHKCEIHYSWALVNTETKYIEKRSSGVCNNEKGLVLSVFGEPIKYLGESYELSNVKLTVHAEEALNLLFEKYAAPDMKEGFAKLNAYEVIAMDRDNDQDRETLNIMEHNISLSDKADRDTLIKLVSETPKLKSIYFDEINETNRCLKALTAGTFAGNHEFEELVGHVDTLLKLTERLLVPQERIRLAKIEIHRASGKRVCYRLFTTDKELEDMSKEYQKSKDSYSKDSKHTDYYSFSIKEVNVDDISIRELDLPFGDLKKLLGLV